MARCGWGDCGRWRPTALARRMRGGVVMNGAWYCSRQCAERALAADLTLPERLSHAGRRAALPPLKLGMLLVHHGAVTPADLKRALDAQRETGLPVGRQLVALGCTDSLAVLKALATQTNVPFLASLDGSAVRACPDLLGPATVRALGLVPFGVDADLRKVKVACTAPIPRLAMAAFTELTGWTAEPYLVSDEVLPGLYEAYQGACGDRGGAALTVTTLDAAPGRVAMAASEVADAEVRQAACDPYLWVRITGIGPTSDVFVAPAKEHRWQVAPTSH